MKIQFSLPSNEDFFNRYATLIPTLTKFGYLAQFISAMTEIGVLYAIACNKAKDFFDPAIASIIAISFSLVVTLLLEIGLRRFLPYSIQAILYRRFGGLDLFMSLAIFIISIGLLLSSGLLSFKGSWDLVDYATNEPIEETNTVIDSSYSESKGLALLEYSRDSLTIAQGYQLQIDSEKKAINSAIRVQETKLNKYKNREESTGKSYRSSIDRINTKIAEVEAKGDEAIRVLEAAKGTELNSLYKEYKFTVSEKTSSHKEGIAEIARLNIERKKERLNKVDRYGGSLGYFTVFCLLFLLLAVTLQEINKKGSGIEQIAQPTQYHFSDSVSNEFLNMVDEKYNYVTRRIIFNLASNTPAPPLPSAPPTLFDLAKTKQQRVRVEIEDPESEVIKVKPGESSYAPKGSSLPVGKEELEKYILENIRASSLLEAYPVSKELTDTAAREALKIYLGKDASPNDIREAIEEIRQSLTLSKQGGQDPGEVTIETRTIVKEDSKTIAHKDKRTGEIKYYAMGELNNFIRKYKTRVAEAKENRDKLLTKSRQDTLNYWISRKEELLSKSK